MLLDATTFSLEDVVLAVAAAAMVAAVIISATVLSRYRALAADAAKSNELAKDLWIALENRLKKQDERIVDLMARVEIYGVRSELKEPSTSRTRAVAMQAGALKEVARSRPTTRPAAIERIILKKLVEGSRSSTEIKALIDKSREHTARLMKALFDDGYVVRNDRDRPFVYEITELGKRYLEESRSAGT